MKSLRKIADLEKFSDPVEEVKKLWDPVEELDYWAAEVGRLGIPWTTKIDWNKPRQNNCYHPSSFPKSCDMYQFLEMSGARRKPKVGVRERKTYDIGTTGHGLMDYYRGTRALYHDYIHIPEFSIIDMPRARELRMGGDCDGYVERTIKGLHVRMVEEYKTIGTNGFNGLRHRAKKDHVIQTTSYMHALDVPIGVIIYVNKENVNFCAFIIRFEEYIWKPVRERMVRINALYDAGKEADRRIGKSCAHCDLLEQCGPDVSSVEGWKGGNQWKSTRRKRGQRVVQS